ncbi:class I SAM-dependent methyltransferase [Umezawaea tangerina]|uniref:Thiopurine S-methyltransferase n=1 Tax=Umezawaea tangerina TaxID=84725 RepID=A0A2T0T3Q5_9PSEU|nr:class I SAM-dependent methyltransferase [Umezawaea tangerina]PRY40292.1 thiopurine S-methyltransferase [Umezawaea tangerina]
MSTADDAHTRHLAAADPTGWFEHLYAEAENGTANVPWDVGDPHGLLVAWARDLDGTGRRALVVGCGLGRDSEFVAARGFATTAFDIAPTAIATTRRRFPDSPVDYRVADLFAPPADWHRSFDLVVESITVQALPVALHQRAIAAIADFVAPGGTLLAIAVARDDVVPEGPPWPLTEAEVRSFATGGLREVSVDRPDGRWCAEFRRG